ncbi:uncharacterized protein ACA1_295900 [Acanthamoeba castellanii str. Neff]|uniref:Uncharacterized protein n=1 Tax=Acanthamoeba castellanii (strain ATCC 30010 / Neff) TaxID=1257118 RepID=L8HLF5_ACACF|nr:uncharacterized protein ACA1_295900 [Acanthamoeba castellanii str. Neff]ELR25503.1 hypothetical protein ACA1_295900 [Acanthamoeba castellanii str. Neff]
MDALLGAYGDDDDSEQEEVQQTKDDVMNVVDEPSDQSTARKRKQEEKKVTLPPPPFASEQASSSSATKSSPSKKAKMTSPAPGLVKLPSLDLDSGESSFAAPTYSAPPPMKLVEPPADYETKPRRRGGGRGQFVPPQVRRGRPNVPTEETISYDEATKKNTKSPAKTN